MQLEVFKPLNEMSATELVDQFIYCHAKHRPLKLGIRQSNEYMKKHGLGPANIAGYMEDLTNREVYGLRKMQIRDYLIATNPKVHGRPGGFVNWRKYLQEEKDRINKFVKGEIFYDPYKVYTPDTTGIEIKLTPHFFSPIKQLWESIDMPALLALAGTAHVDLPSGWGAVKGQEDSVPKPFTAHITLPKGFEWVEKKDEPTDNTNIP